MVMASPSSIQKNIHINTYNTYAYIHEVYLAQKTNRDSICLETEAKFLSLFSHKRRRKTWPSCVPFGWRDTKFMSLLATEGNTERQTGEHAMSLLSWKLQNLPGDIGDMIGRRGHRNPPPPGKKGQNKGHTRELILLREFVNNLCASFLGVVTCCGCMMGGALTVKTGFTCTCSSIQLEEKATISWHYLMCTFVSWFLLAYTDMPFIWQTLGISVYASKHWAYQSL